MTLTVLNLHQETDPKVQQDFTGQGHYNKFKSRSHHDAAHLQPSANVPTKYQLPRPYGFRDIAQTRFYRSRSLWQGQIKVRPRCTPTPPCCIYSYFKLSVSSHEYGLWHSDVVCS